MAASCERLHEFADGELPIDEVQAFQRHVATCVACQAALQDVMVLEALGQGLTTVSSEVSTVATTASVPVLGQEEAESGATPIQSHRRVAPRRTIIWGAIAAVAAGVTLVAMVDRRPADPLASLTAEPTRPFAARLAYASADWHRPLHTMRGDEPAHLPQLGNLGRLEEKGDYQGMAAAYLLSGDATQAAAYLERAPHTPAVDTDRAVVAMQQGRWLDAKSLLAAVLAAEPHHAQALWNLALVLERLGDAEKAATQFELVATLGEPGWSDEAKDRARAIRQALPAQPQDR